MIMEIHYTLRPLHGLTTVELAEWVRRKMGSGYTSHDCLMVARALVRGEVWKCSYWLVTEPEAPGPCAFMLIEEPNKYAEFAAKQDKLRALCEKGAAGDAAAAIAYCQAERDGLVSHAPMG